MLEWDFISHSSSLPFDLPAGYSLIDHLSAQAREAFLEKEDLVIAEALFRNLDEKGFLSIALHDLRQSLNVSSHKLQRVLSIVQTFDPAGIAAQSIKECLLLQLKAKNKRDSLAYHIVDKSYEDLLQSRFEILQKKYKITRQTLKKDVIEELKSLSLRPTRTHFSEVYLYPDLLLRKEGIKWTLEVNEKDLPFFRIKNEYQIFLNRCACKKEKEILQSYLNKGKWLMRNLNRRRKILLQVGLFIVKKQQGFLEGKRGLIPLTIKEIAQKLCLHESTIARACNEKCIDTPFGVKPLRFFLSHSVGGKTNTSAAALLEILSELLKKEDKFHPYSDRQIAEKLQEKGISCARRTIAKYRKKLVLSPRRGRKIMQT